MIRIDIQDEQATAALEKVAASLANPRSLMQDLGDALVQSTKLRFQEGKSPAGAAWAPKSQTTIAAYLARGQRVDPRPLFGPSGDLHQYIFAEVGPEGSSVEVGTNAIYAAVMQFGAAQGAFGRTSRGGPIPWGNIPARPFIGLSANDQAEIVASVEEWLEVIAAQAG